MTLKEAMRRTHYKRLRVSCENDYEQFQKSELTERCLKKCLFHYSTRISVYSFLYNRVDGHKITTVNKMNCQINCMFRVKNDLQIFDVKTNNFLFVSENDKFISVFKNSCHMTIFERLQWWELYVSGLRSYVLVDGFCLLTVRDCVYTVTFFSKRNKMIQC